MSAIPDELLYPAQAAEALKLSPKTLEQWRWRGEGPRFFKLGRMVRYRRADLDAWLDGCAALPRKSAVDGVSASAN